MTDERLYIKMTLDILAHPKLAGATPAVKWLYAASMIVSKRELSDGVVRAAVACAEAEVPGRAGAELLRRNLWHAPGHDCDRCEQPPEGRVMVHDFLLHQTSRADIEATRKRKAAAGRKGAARRWHSTSHSTSHDTSHSESDGRTDANAMAETWPDVRLQTSDINPVAEPSRRLTFPAGLSDDDLARIEKTTGGDRRHAERVVADILSRSTEEPKRPLAYVLRAIGAEPDRYKPTRRGVRKGEVCATPGHTDKANGCKQCASERLAGA